MLPKYRFSLKTDSDQSARVVHPVWSDDLSVEWKLESNQMFHRSELSGSLDFLRDDFDYIIGKPFGTVFNFEIETSDNGAMYIPYWKGKFTLIDCKVNVDDKKLTVKPQTVDLYTDILAGLEKEFDLIKLAPAINKIRLSKRPALQILDTASETITCICGNLSFEQEISLPMENLANFLREHCHFMMLDSQVQIQMRDYPPFQQEQFVNPFIGTISGDGSNLTNGGAYFIKYRQTGLPVTGYIRQLQIISYAQPDDVKWQYEDTVLFADYDFPYDIEFVSQHAPEADLHGNCTDHGLYSRVICNVKVAGTTDTFEIPSDDIVPYNRNYNRCYPYDASALILTSQRVSNEPTEWGLNDDGFYYLPPDDENQYIPIGQNLWGINSVWLKKTNDYTNIEVNATYQFMLNDAYPLYSAIQALLNQVAPYIRFEGTSDFSRFLYSGSDPLQLRNNALWLTPKSNITNGEYQTPAQKAPVTLKQVFDMLRNTYRCYWFLEENYVYGDPNDGEGEYITQQPTQILENSFWYIDNTIHQMNGFKVRIYNIIPGQKYFFSNMFSSGTNIFCVAWYDENGKLLSYEPYGSVMGRVDTWTNQEVVPPNGAAYLYLNTQDAYDSLGLNYVSRYRILGAYLRIEHVQYFLNGGSYSNNPSVGIDLTALRNVRNEKQWSFHTSEYEFEKSEMPERYQFGWMDEVTDIFNGQPIEMVSNNVEKEKVEEITVGNFTSDLDFMMLNPSAISQDGFALINALYDSSQGVYYVPIITFYFAGYSYRVQNPYLTFHMLQWAYWKYNMPSRYIKIEGDMVRAESISKNKKQTVNAPVGLSDPNLMRLVRSAIGTGKIHQANIRMTTRIAKIQLRYDTE